MQQCNGELNCSIFYDTALYNNEDRQTATVCNDGDEFQKHNIEGRQQSQRVHAGLSHLYEI